MYSELGSPISRRIYQLVSQEFRFKCDQFNQILNPESKTLCIPNLLKLLIHQIKYEIC